LSIFNYDAPAKTKRGKKSKAKANNNSCQDKTEDMGFKYPDNHELMNRHEY